MKKNIPIKASNTRPAPLGSLASHPFSQKSSFISPPAPPNPTSQHSELDDNFGGRSSYNHVTASIVEVVSMPKTHYDQLIGSHSSLVTEHKYLREQLEAVCCERDSLRLEILSKLGQIKELEQQNRLLRDEIEKLKSLLNTTNDRLAIAEHDLTTLMTEKRTDRLIVALQDLNSREQLEGHATGDITSILFDLKQDRIALAHYLDDRDTNHEYEYKKVALLNILKSLSSEVSDALDELYPGIRDFAVTYLTNHPYTGGILQLPPNQRSKVKRWWSSFA